METSNRHRSNAPTIASASQRARMAASYPNRTRYTVARALHHAALVAVVLMIVGGI